jgi:hypothetical protein
MHFEDSGRQLESTHCFGETIVVCEHHDLAGGSYVSKHVRQSVNLGRVHGLDRVVDDHEPERAVVGRGAG